LRLECKKAIPHGQIGVTTVGKVRQAGGDVICDSSREPNYATLTELKLKPQEMSDLLTPTIPNPSR
jgi:hypothetical protein